jgi:tetratricopeptide (TPR) repeat protein
VASNHYNLALVAAGLDESALAHRRFSAALAIWEEAYGGDHHLVGHALTGLGQSLLGLRRPAEALPPLERALRLRLAPGTDPSLLASTRLTLARALAESGGDAARARELARAALAGFDQAGDEAGANDARAWLTERGGDR